MSKKNTTIFFILSLLLIVGWIDLGFCSDVGFGEIEVPPAEPALPVNYNSITLLVGQFQAKASAFGTALQTYAERLFVLFLILDIALFGVSCALGATAIQDVFKKLIMLLLFSGFVLAVIRNYQDWSHDFVYGLLNVSVELGAPKLDLSPLRIGLDIFNRTINETFLAGPIDKLAYAFLGLIILICFTLMTAKIILVKCESFLVLNAAVILLGFGAFGVLKDYAINVMRYCLSVAFKLFVMQLLLGIGIAFFNDFMAANALRLSYELFALYIAASIILLALTYTIPEAAAGIISGSHTGSGHAILASAAAVGGAVAGAMKAAGGGATKTSRGFSSIQEAVKMAQMDGAKGFGQVAKGAAGNLWSANQAARQSKNAMGSVGQRMNAHLKEGVAVRQNQASSAPPKEEPERGEEE